MKKIFTVAVLFFAFVAAAEAYVFDVYAGEALFVQQDDGSRFLITFQPRNRQDIRRVDTQRLFSRYGVVDVHVLRNTPEDIERANTSWYYDAGNLNIDSAVAYAIADRDGEIRMDGRARARAAEQRHREMRYILKDLERWVRREGWRDWRRHW